MPRATHHLIALGLAATEAFAATTPRWVELAPPPLAGAAAVYDSAHSRLLLVDASPQGADRGAVWEVAFPSGAYSELETTPVPAGIQPRALILDATANRLVAFVGAIPANGTPARVVTLDLSSKTWGTLATTGLPPDADGGYSAIYDPQGRRMIVFGGHVAGAGFDYSNRVFALSLDGAPTWSQFSIGGTLPNGRRDHTAVYDAAANRMIVFGGYFDSSPSGIRTTLDEAWSLSLSGSPAWTFLVPAGFHPAARSAHVAVSSGAQMLMFGGTPNGSDETWALDFAASTTTASWVKLDSPTNPGSRWSSQGVWDGSRLLLQGGRVFVGITSDLWALSPQVPAWTALSTNSYPSPNSFPPPQISEYAAAIDSGMDRMVVAGGSVSSPLGCCYATDQTWTRSLVGDTGWQLTNAPLPTPLRSLGSAADPLGERMIVYGGFTNSPHYEPNDLRAFAFTSNIWQPLPNASPPPARYYALYAFDEAGRRFFLYGGVHSAVYTGNTYYGDTWAYDAFAGTWQLLPGTFGKRIQVTGIYDPIRNRLIAFGGQDTLKVYNDLHTLDLSGGGTWSPLAANGTAPAAKTGATAAYDPVEDRMLLFTTSNGTDEPGTLTYALSLGTSPAWTLLSPTGRIPVHRIGAVPVFDAKRGRFLIHGGLTHNDTWAFVLDESTPARLDLVDADVHATLVRVRWYSAEAVPGQPAVLRRVGGGEWARVGFAMQDGTGMIVYEDRDIAPGQRIDYKLHVGDEDFGMVSVSIPSAGGSLRLTIPSPSFGAPQVAIELVDGSPARLELYDVSGRRVFERRLEGPGVIALARHSPGVYFLRLVQGTNEIRRKIAIAG